MDKTLAHYFENRILYPWANPATCWRLAIAGTNSMLHKALLSQKVDHTPRIN
jgi:hypothetical protein